MKTRKIITIVFTWIAVLMVLLSGSFKLMGGAEVIKTLTPLGVADYMLWLGLMEIVFALLFAYPKTMKIGFILLSCYFAGALATELSHGSPFKAFIPIMLIWIAAFLRDQYIFLPRPEATNK
jgi:hypothetical protein